MARTLPPSLLMMKVKHIAGLALPLLALAAVACDKETKVDQAPAADTQKASNSVAIEVGADGFQPSSVTAEKGEPLTLEFTRTSDATCAKDVAFPELGIKKELPLNQPVAIQIPTSKTGKLTFQFGMGMYKSSVVVN